jgi:quinohemoprotein ethanol dehydrogenase
MGVRGYVTAYDAQSGKQQWRFYTVPRPDGGSDGEVSDDVLAAKANSSWSDGEWKKTGGGGTVWDAIVYDQEFDQILLGVGNGSPWNHDVRSGGKGDNLFLSSVVALDAKTGKYKWHYQETPGESWDFTATQPITLATMTIEGRQRKVLMQAPKNGFFYVLDRQTGKLVSAKNFTKVTWATSINPTTGRPVEVPAARYHDAAFLMYPSAYGAHNWYPMSFSPRTGLVYLPIQEVPFFYQRDTEFRVRGGAFNTGIYSDKNAFPTDKAQKAALRAMAKGALIAWDPVAQKEVWRVAQPGPANAGTMVTAGDLVFEGNPQGTFQAFDARNGKTLWKFQAQTTVAGSPVTYSIDGEQYVLVVSGAGGSFAVSSPFFDDRKAKPNGRVLAFKLGGNAVLPRYDAPSLPPATAPADTFSDLQVAQGERIFEMTCSWCHGAATESGGIIPDLRRSPALADKDTWQQVVLGGILAERGMVSFSRSLSVADAEAVRAYVATKSHLLAKEEKSK